MNWETWSTFYFIIPCFANDAAKTFGRKVPKDVTGYKPTAKTVLDQNFNSCDKILVDKHKRSLMDAE